MRLRIDHLGVARFKLISATRYPDERRYYVARDALAIVVCRSGLKLRPEMVGQVVDVRMDWDNGTPGFVLEHNQGKRHSKATLYRIVQGNANLSLSDFLSRAPKPIQSERSQ